MNISFNFKIPAPPDYTPVEAVDWKAQGKESAEYRQLYFQRQREGFERKMADKQTEILDKVLEKHHFDPSVDLDDPEVGEDILEGVFTAIDNIIIPKRRAAKAQELIPGSRSRKAPNNGLLRMAIYNDQAGMKSSF
ncbi:hypothetical protein BDN70DRAFT_900309 [Pholiota conissans]|uniref:Uncharacterized protein n=1 Tax=Pholiota conissans TaxID=109636 RepID=A0A9P5YPM4_9AGAR|nr:hypothetical protein BDN70DRAFT_900309 [Pholiota conissans]